VNIFVLDYDPILAARMHCDKHCVKMVLESCQILSTVVYDQLGHAPYKPTHRSHPCVLWAARSSANARWLVRLTDTLFIEYTARYGKTHKSQEVLEELKRLLRDCRFGQKELTPFVQAMPDQYREADTVRAYRAYYMGEKSKFAKWRSGDTPNWFIS